MARLLVVWCPDWPVTAAAVAAGISVHRPAAVFSANRVVACSAVARANGVRRGMRRRDAQGRCPDLAVLAADSAQDARLFEPVAAAVEELVVGVDVVRPGVVAVPAKGATSYFGGEHNLIERLVDHVSDRAGAECQIGIACGLFAAVLAARRSTVVAEGATAEFLGPLPIGELDQPDEGRSELVDLLRRLGLRTLGQFAELSERVVASRFGQAGVPAHRLARGQSERPLARRNPPQDLAVVETFDPPLDRVDAAAFVARTLADRLHSGLTAHDLACTRLGIYAVTEAGEELSRVWRCAEPVSAHGTADRVRWQFEGWLRAEAGYRPTSGVVQLRLEPEEIVEGSALQLGLWQGGCGPGNGNDLADERAGRALVRVQGLLGPEGACTPVLVGGRGPADRVRLVPWGDPRGPGDDELPWPGRLPAPSPSTVFAHQVKATVADQRGGAVALTGRNGLTGVPHQVAVAGSPARRVLAWAGPWPVDERWWEAGAAGVRARIHVLVGEGAEQSSALLMLFRSQEHPQWTVEGVYD
ncbi:MAG: DNA polymerase Y family protein [Pseudonocardiaceae bacterium]